MQLFSCAFSLLLSFTRCLLFFPRLLCSIIFKKRKAEYEDEVCCFALLSLVSPGLLPILFLAEMGSERLQPRRVNRIPSLLLCFGSSLTFLVFTFPLVSFFFFLSFLFNAEKFYPKDWTDEEISVIKH